MADQTAIDAIKAELPDTATAMGFTDLIIGTYLDQLMSKSRIILAGWRAIVAKTATITDVTESGSTRNFSVINNNARQMVTYWQGIVDKEDAAGDTGPVQRFRSHRATRV